MNYKEKTWLAMLIGGALISGTAAAETYYVSPNGNDGQAGSAANPWQTLQHAADQLGAGDTLRVQPGTYEEKVYLNASGTAAQPLRIEAEGAVTLEGFVINGDHVQVAGFSLETLACDGDSYGFDIRGDSCLIEGNRITQFPDGGLLTKPSSQGCVIRNNLFRDNVTTGLEIHGNNHLVEGNEVVHPIEVHPIAACRTWSDDANGVWFFGSGHVFRGNKIHGLRFDQYVRKAHMDCFQTFGGWMSGDPAINSNMVIENNECEAMAYQAADEYGKGIQIEDIDGLLIRNNVFRGAGGIGDQVNSSNLRILNNTFISAPKVDGKAIANHRAIDIWHPNTTNVEIANNVMVDFMDAPLYIYSKNTTATVRNNLAWWTDGVNHEPGYGGFACGSNGNLCADPQFLDAANHDYRQGAGSPLIDAGATLAEVTVDLLGTARPQLAAHDIGAYEYGTGGSELAIATATLPSATVGSAYSASLQASGGQAPYQWTLAGGSLPDGLSLALDGSLQGVPSSEGDFGFEVQLSDDGGANVTRSLSLPVAPVDDGGNGGGEEPPAVSTDLRQTLEFGNEPASPQVGAAHLFVARSYNDGEETASNAVLNVSLPAGAVFLSGEQCSSTANGAECALGDIPAGERRTRNLYLRLNQGGDNSVSASVSSDTQDDNPANDSATASVNVAAGADVSVTLKKAWGRLKVGRVISYRAVTRNAGPSAAENVDTIFAIPANATFRRASSACTFIPAWDEVRCNWDRIPAGARRTANIQVRLTDSGELFAEVDSEADNADPNPGNNATSLTLQVR